MNRLEGGHRGLIFLQQSNFGNPQNVDFRRHNPIFGGYREKPVMIHPRFRFPRDQFVFLTRHIDPALFDYELNRIIDTGLIEIEGRSVPQLEDFVDDIAVWAHETFQGPLESSRIELSRDIFRRLVNKAGSLDLYESIKDLEGRGVLPPHVLGTYFLPKP